MRARAKEAWTRTHMLTRDKPEKHHDDLKGEAMNRFTFWVFGLSVLAIACVSAQQSSHRDGISGSGAMTIQELNQEPITCLLNISYADTACVRQQLDLYLPRKPRGSKLPVIVFVPGLNWMQGDKSDGAHILIPFVRTGEYVGVSINYRFSSEAIWPAQIHDCKAAIRWIRAHAAKYGMDADHIGVWGESAGAHLALMLGVCNNVAVLEDSVGRCGHISSRVAAVVDCFGVTDLPALVGNPSALNKTLPGAPEAMLIGGPLREIARKLRRHRLSRTYLQATRQY